MSPFTPPVDFSEKPGSFSTEMLLDLLDNTSLVIYLKDVRGRYLFVNRRYAELAGVDREVIIGREDHELFPEPVARLFKEQDQQVIQAGIEQEFEETIPLPGGVLSFITFKVPLRGSDGEVYGVGGFCTDITSRDPGETETLAAERERLAATFKSIAEAVISTDVEGRILTVNRAAESLFGMEQAGFYGRSPADFNPLSRIEPDPVKTLMDSGQECEFGEYGFLDHLQQEKQITVSGSRVVDRSGSPIGTVLSIRDVTERMRLMKELNHSRRLESLEIFAAGIAHDFNNLLTIVLGNIDMMSRLNELPPGIDRYLQKSRKALSKARDLTGQLLTYATGVDPEKEAVSLGKLLQDVSQVALGDSEIRCDLQVPADLLQVDGDLTQLSQVFQNLLINASQAMDGRGQISIQLRNIIMPGSFTDPEARVPGVEVRICDQGAGIPEAICDQIFDPYFSTRKDGTGLGLAIAYSIIGRHQGTIAVENLPQGGACFRVSLPASASAGRPDF